MRILFEQPGGRLVRLRPHDYEGTHLVAHLLDAASGDLLRLAERPAHGGNRRVVLFRRKLSSLLAEQAMDARPADAGADRAIAAGPNFSSPT